MDSLQTLASKSSGIRLVAEWANAKMSTKNVLFDDYCHCCTCPDHDRYIRRMYEIQMPPRIGVPPRIQRLIEDNITPVLIQVENWIVYHHSKLFFHDNPASSLNEYLVKLIWKTDYSIDYQATAKNILTSAKLNDLEKFRFASTYCLVDEIENFKQLADIVADLDFKKEPFLVYWSKYLRNELHTIVLSKKISIETVMFQISLKQYGLWPSIAHFFAKLNAANKFQEFDRFVKYCGKQYRLELLEKLNDPDWTDACRHSIDKVVKIFAKCDHFEVIPYVWNRFKDEVRSKSFYGIFIELVPLSMRNSRSFNALTPLLIDIWTNGRAELRNWTMQACMLDRIGVGCSKVVCDENFDFESCRELENPLRFFRALFESCEDDQKRRFISVNFLWMIIWQPLASVVELLRENLVDYQYVENLKFELKYSVGLQLVCAKMLQFGRFDEFNEIVMFCWFDQRYPAVSLESVSDYKKSMAMSPLGAKALCGYLYLHDWRGVLEFLVDVFFNEADASYFVMCVLIESGVWTTRFIYLAHEKCFLRRKICRGGLRDVMDIVNILRQRREFAFQAMRLICIHTLFTCVFNENEEFIFRESEIRNFLVWCYGSENIADERFRTSATSVYPQGFLGQLKSCVDGFIFRASDSMEEFLRWSFKERTQIRHFKREMIYNHRKYKLIGDMLAQRRYRTNMLKWFFEDEDDFIEKFVNEELKTSMDCNELVVLEY